MSGFETGLQYSELLKCSIWSSTTDLSSYIFCSGTQHALKLLFSIIQRLDCCLSVLILWSNRGVVVWCST